VLLRRSQRQGRFEETLASVVPNQVDSIELPRHHAGIRSRQFMLLHILLSFALYALYVLLPIIPAPATDRDRGLSDISSGTLRI
jgi:hypothetical protein